MNIEDLSRKEDKLLLRMPTKGYFEDRNMFLEMEGIYQEWQDIFVEYSKLAISGELEASKRAIFFLWYQTCEPPALSGIKNLDREYIARVLDQMNLLIEENKIDVELSWMLPYYYMISEWYFPDSTKVSTLKTFSLKNQELWKVFKNKSTFINRGQLGGYWQSIQL